jgi:SPP1 gp7 family putative phage head morphogenesis protein
VPTLDVLDLADKFRTQALARERRAASELVHAYGESWKRIRIELNRLTAQIENARLAGEDVSPSWLFQQERLRSLQIQVEREINHFAIYANKRIQEEQRAEIAAARNDAGALMKAASANEAGIELSFSQLPTGAVENMVGFLGDGTPLGRVLDRWGAEASKATSDRLVQAIVLGHGPRQIARDLRADFGGSLTKALTIARTEVLRSYRQAAHQTYKKNSDVIDGWIWQASLSGRTCPACIALNGTFHTVDETLDDHVNGKCTMLPKTKPWADLGFGGVEETSIEIESGEDWFARQAEKTQRSVLGDAGFEAYNSGAVKLGDFVGTNYSPQWGTMRYAKSLKEILGDDGARHYRMKVISKAIRNPPKK